MTDSTLPERGRPPRRRAVCRTLLVLVFVLGGAASSGAVAQSALVAASQPRQGELVARARIDAQTEPQPGDFTLQLGPDTVVAAAAVAPVAPPPASAALLLCLDRSGSMGAEAIATMQAVLRRVLVPRPGETELPISVAIVTFGTRSTHLLGLTTDPARIARALDGLTPDRDREGRTVLYDAVAGGLAELRASDLGQKRLLVVSDGNDEGSSLSQKALIERMAEPPSVAVDAIGFGALAASASGSLATLAGATGGRFAVSPSRSELGDVLARMVRQAVPPPLVDVRFVLPPSTPGRSPADAVLRYRPRAGTPASFAIAADLLQAPPDGRAAADAAAEAADAEAGRWNAARQRFAALPPAVRLGGAVALLAAAVLVGAALRRRGRTVPPVVGPVVVDEPASPAIDVEPGGGDVEPGGGDVAGHRTTRFGHRWPLPGDGRTVAVLHGVAGAVQGQRIRLMSPSVRIGAAADNDLVLRDDDFVSGHHAVLKAEANALYVVDLGSRNGSELNGVRFGDATRSLSPGDRVTLGRSTFEVLAAEPRDGESRVG